MKQKQINEQKRHMLIVIKKDLFPYFKTLHKINGKSPFHVFISY